ncbi:MAG: AAA family ATPase [Geodermatophilaceae bacterium]
MTWFLTSGTSLLVVESEQGHRLVVVTPTLKAAKAAAAEVGAQAGSAAWLAHQHGWRWTDTGIWTRLTIGDDDPVTGRGYSGPSERAGLRSGDLVVVDEAGMLDQDTARALLVAADEHAVRVALLGDRHQLAAVGRGGVLDLAARWADPQACVTLDVVHRFTRTTDTADGSTVTVPDTDYAQLTGWMRTGEQPAAVFDALAGRGLIRVHANEAERQAAIADTVAAHHAQGAPVALVADTGEQVAELNAAIRDRLVTAGAVDDTHVVTTLAGQRVGTGDQIATRRNDRALDVANRDTWTVTSTHRDGGLCIARPAAGERELPAGYVEAHVELAYATTAHGAQGATATTAHLVISEHTGAAAAYVGMTRGRRANTAHLIAADYDEACEQWVTTFSRDRADLGPDHARHAAEHAAAGYAQTRPVSEIIAALRQEWDSEARDVNVLAWAVPLRDDLRQIAQLQQRQAEEVGPLEARYRQAGEACSRANATVNHSTAVIAAETEHRRDALLATWGAQRPEAHANARTALDGPGRLGLQWAAVNRAHEALARWSVSWQAITPTMPTGHAAIAGLADRADDTPRVYAALEDHARRQAQAGHPEHARNVAHAAATHRETLRALGELREARGRYQRELGYYGRLGDTEDPGQRLTPIDRQIADAEQRLGGTRGRIAHLEERIAAAGPGGSQAAPVPLDTSRLGLPADAVLSARRQWLDERDAAQHAARLQRAHAVATADSRRESQSQEAWRRNEPAPRLAGPDQGISR